MPRKSRECLTKEERIRDVLLAFKDDEYFPDILNWLESLPDETFIDEAKTVYRHLTAVLTIRNISINAGNIQSNQHAIQTGMDRSETLDTKGINYRKSHTISTVRSIYGTLRNLTDTNNQSAPSWTKVQEALAVTPDEIEVWEQGRDYLTSAERIFQEREDLRTKSRTPDEQTTAEKVEDLLYGCGVEIAILAINKIVDFYHPEPEA